VFLEAASLVFDKMWRKQFSARLTWHLVFSDPKSGFVVVCACRYVAVYFSMLYTRYRTGLVTRDMLALPKHRFVAIGLLEALGVAAGMSAGGSFVHVHSENGVIDFYR
jgi:hypothetical protein